MPDILSTDTPNEGRVKTNDNIAGLQADISLRFKDVTLTQAEYDALVTKDPDTVYWVTG